MRVRWGGGKIVVMRSFKGDEIKALVEELEKVNLEPFLKSVIPIMDSLVKSLYKEFPELSDKEKESMVELINSLMPYLPSLIKFLGPDSVVVKLLEGISKLKAPTVKADISVNETHVATVNIEVSSFANLVSPMITTLAPVVTPLIPTLTKNAQVLPKLLPLIEELSKPENINALVEMISSLVKLIPTFTELLKILEKPGMIDTLTSTMKAFSG